MRSTKGWQFRSSRLESVVQAQPKKRSELQPLAPKPLPELDVVAGLPESRGSARMAASLAARFAEWLPDRLKEVPPILKAQASSVGLKIRIASEQKSPAAWDIQIRPCRDLSLFVVPLAELAGLQTSWHSLWYSFDGDKSCDHIGRHFHGPRLNLTTVKPRNDRSGFVAVSSSEGSPAWPKTWKSVSASGTRCAAAPGRFAFRRVSSVCSICPLEACSSTGQGTAVEGGKQHSRRRRSQQICPCRTH